MATQISELLESQKLEFRKLGPTRERPGSEGTYIVRISTQSLEKLAVADGSYVRIHYGKASVLGCVKVDAHLADDMLRLDQTLRTAIGLDRIMQGSGDREDLANDCRILVHPIYVTASTFKGPGWLSRLIKHQYLVCFIHHALPEDMETPLVRLPKTAMDVLGIQAGGKVLLCSEENTVRLRCLLLDSRTTMPLESMKNHFTQPWEDEQGDTTSLLPWIAIDLQTRLKLKVDPWQPIFVSRDPIHALVSEFDQIVVAVALAAVLGTVGFSGYEWQIMVFGLVMIFWLIFTKLRSRI